MKFNRASGILLHPTSLPGPDGIGDLGPEAYRWIDFLSASGCSLWQILPLGPTGYGDSPYQCFSAFAGNPYLVSPVLLIEDGLLTSDDLIDRPLFEPGPIDYGAAIQWKLTLLERAYQRFCKSKPKTLVQAFTQFQNKHQNWLPDFALFMAIKESLGGGAWSEWPEDFRKRNPQTIETFTSQNPERIERHIFRQFLFFRQWDEIHNYAHTRDIKIIGDIPIFVAFDSADAWSHPELFYFDENRKPTVVAGVPPDYFSPTGQLWGNPLYKWEVHAETKYHWWIERLQSTLSMVDFVRLDHFRGFVAYWEVKATETTAVNGRWVKGPGDIFFKTVGAALGDLPIIAEDLGDITPDVFELRDQFNLPGMKILQFGMESKLPTDPFLPHNYPTNCVAYPGTHDNDTTVGWYLSAKEEDKDFTRRYLARSGEDIAWDFIRSIWGSVAMFAIAPIQDFLSLGSSARMNFPGHASGNWCFRLSDDALSASLGLRIYDLNFLYRRLAEQNLPAGSAYDLPARIPA